MCYEFKFFLNQQEDLPISAGGPQQKTEGYFTVFSRGKPNPHCAKQSLFCIPSIFICGGGGVVCFPEELPFKDKSVPAWHSFNLRESQLRTTVSADGPIHHFP